MSRSLNFNGIDMSSYELIVTSPGINLLKQLVGYSQLQDKAYSCTPMRAPRHITVDFAVTGTSLADLDSNLDIIKYHLTQTEPKKLKFDSLNLRYFNAILEDFEGEYSLATVFQGRLMFICPDPLGYRTTEDEHSHSIDASPKTVTEGVGGTAYVKPVYTLTAKNTLTGVTLKLENTDTEEELQWTGNLAINGTLVIDVANWLVSKGVTADMSTVSGQFPRLKPRLTNHLKVTGLYTTVTGNLNILYRDTYS